MASSLQIHVYDKQQAVYKEVFSGEVELGRQRDGKEKLYACRKDGDRARVAIARLDEDTVSRDHARIEPLPDSKARITNISAKVSIRLADGSELKAGAATEVPLPAVIYLGRKAVRLQVPETREPPLRGLGGDQIAPPLTIVSGAPGRFPTLDGIKSIINPGTGVAAPSINLQTQMEEVIRWLQQTMEVLHSAASSSDFFQKAAQATVDIVGLDRGRVLVREGDNWKPVATCSSPKFSAKTSEWTASHQVLSRVVEEKRTFWQAPEDANLEDSESLVGIEVIVASPILNPQGDVIGAIYGDVHQESFQPNAPKITRLEAIVIELLARGVAVGLARMEQERMAIQMRVQFEQFFTRELSQQLALEPNLLEGRDADVTLLFCDIRGFSRISEKLGPEGTVRWVGQVMGTLSDAVLKYQGVLVDYIGDELLAMWGAPIEQPDHAELACRAALDMLAALPIMNERWQPILEEPLHIGIGINTGTARVGNTGSQHKFKYGPLGNTVNLASRVQGASKYLKCTLLVTENTHARLPPTFKTRKLCEVRVVNIKQPVALYELYPDNQPHWPALKTTYETALKEFVDREFRPASRTLANLLGEVHDDGPALVLLSRAVHAAVNGAEEHHPVWDLPGK